jgi:hypothetical protein
VNAKEKRNNYNAIEVMWDRVPGRNEKWKNDILSGMNFDLEKFAQEHECSFIGSSGTLISGAKLKALVHQNPIVQKDDLTMYVHPEKGNSYVIVGDVAHGKGLDYSAFQVIDVTKMPYNQVAVYRSNMITPVDFASTIQRIGTLYNESQVLIENNGIGEAVAQAIYEEYEYENMLSTTNRGGRAGKQIVPAFDAKSEKGVRTTKTVKNIGTSVLKLLIEQDQLIINDYDTINELSTFSKKGSSYEAEPGCHDDLVMCLVLFAWLSNQKYFKELTDINTMNQLRDMNDEDLYESLVPFGVIETGHNPFENVPPAVSKNDDRWLMFDDEIEAMELNMKYSSSSI